MASQEVLTKLEELHRELEHLQPAIRQVEMAQQVIKSIQAIPLLYKELTEEIKKEDLAFKEELKNEQMYLAQLRVKVEDYCGIVQRINFPDRLDKLDNNISTAVLTIQSIQNRLDNLERNMSDRIQDGFEKQAQAQEVFRQELSTKSGRQQIATYVTWVIMVLLAGVVIAILRK